MDGTSVAPRRRPLQDRKSNDDRQIWVLPFGHADQLDALTPHRYPEHRVYTFISGIFYAGLGDQFNPDKLQAYPPGSVTVLPGLSGKLPS